MSLLGCSWYGHSGSAQKGRLQAGVTFKIFNNGYGTDSTQSEQTQWPMRANVGRKQMARSRSAPSQTPVLATRKPIYLHGLLPTNKSPLPKWGGNPLPLEEAAGNTEGSMFPAEAGWNSWEKPINVPPKPLSQKSKGLQLPQAT